MPTNDRNKDGGHSHPQKSDKNENDRGTSKKSSTPGDQGSSKAEGGRKESFGSSGAKDSH